ncbi:MAG TPA: hypothetical protein PLZ93_06505 [Nocardioides sp.]|uniref:hypothetical protein n=1 Tax=uncultured Nocardioides sp. TaxID=198441 RepID=UPI000ED8DFB0|nr:hypothetical protein [uncultured Nocardioides sp.]HCB05739.1 hypothetical protein [Nocardioides sp.]HRD62243.1 hypothetical protein [Nocardioides sp.]HRI95243.1 hypothetical protein [Nocardioides sp.]HRK46783.1 hypothetical protein [Nocardioides sp.]
MSTDEQTSRAAARLGVAALATSCLTLVAGLFGIGPEEPLVWLYGQPISSVAVALTLVTLWLCCWALGAVAAGSRRPRVWLAMLVLVSCGIGFSVLDGATRLARAVREVADGYPSFRVDWDPVPRWILLMTVVGIVGAAVWLLAPRRWFESRPVLVGFGTSLPILSTLVAWVCLPHDGNVIPLGLGDGLDGQVVRQLEAPRSASALLQLSSNAALAASGWLVLITLLSGAAFARDQVNRATRVGTWGPAQHRVTLVLAAGAVLACTLLGFAGVFGSDGEGELWYAGTAWQWAFCAVMAVIGSAGLAWEARHPASRGQFGAMSITAVVLLSLVPVVLMVGSLLQLIAGPLRANDWSDHALDLGLALQRWEPLIAVVAIALLTAVLLRHDRVTTGAVFGVAFVVWAGPSAVQVAVSGAGFDAVDLLASPQRLTLFVGAAVLGFALGARHFGQVRVTLVKALLAAVLVGFGLDALLAGLDDRLVFLLVVLIPVVWRLLRDVRRPERRLAGPVVLSMVTWAALLALAAFTIGAGSGLDFWDTSHRIEWNLLIVPLAFALVCVREPDRSGPVEGKTEEPVRGGVAGAASVGFAAVAAGVVVISAVLGVARFPDPVHRSELRATISLPAGWVPLQCEISDGELGAIASEEVGAAIVFAHTTSKALAEPESVPCGLKPLVAALIGAPGCPDAAAPAAAELSGFRWRECVASERYLVGSRDSDGATEIIVLISDQGDPVGQEHIAAALRTLTFR